MEHTTLHLLYSRFWHKFLYDIGIVNTPEPYAKRTSHGMILGNNGEKMSKSKGNVVNPESEITVYEKNDNLSFLSCGIALNVGGVIKETKNLFYNSPENLAKMGVITNMKHEVLDIDFENKTLKVKNLLTNEEFEDNYDKLVLTLGSWPIVPRFEGGDLENILLLHF